MTNAYASGAFLNLGKVLPACFFFITDSQLQARTSEIILVFLVYRTINPLETQWKIWKILSTRASFSFTSVLSWKTRWSTYLNSAFSCFRWRSVIALVSRLANYRTYKVRLTDLLIFSIGYVQRNLVLWEHQWRYRFGKKVKFLFVLIVYPSAMRLAATGGVENDRGSWIFVTPYQVYWTSLWFLKQRPILSNAVRFGRRFVTIFFLMLETVKNWLL